jgi:hypothetical protein
LYGQFSSASFDDAETPVEQDERIQIIGERDDDVFVFCEPGFFPAPENTGVIQNSSSDFVIIRWTPVPGSTVCQIQGGVTGGPTQSLLVYADEDGNEPDRRRIPKSALQLGEVHEFQVRCACSEDPLVASEFSQVEFFIPLDGSGAIEITEGVDYGNAGHGTMTMSVFPNPSTEGFVNVNLTNVDGMATEGMVEITDITGRRIMQERVAVSSHQTLRVNTNDIPAGIYTISYTSGAERVTSRFILK